MFLLMKIHNALRTSFTVLILCVSFVLGLQWKSYYNTAHNVLSQTSNYGWKSDDLWFDIIVILGSLEPWIKD